MDHMDLYDFVYCGFAQLRMIAAGDAKEEGTAVRRLPIRKHRGARENGIASAMPFFSFLP